MLGSLLPWVNVPLLGSISGIGGDGSITLVLGVVAGVFGLVAGLGRARLTMHILASLCAALATAIAILDLREVLTAVDEARSEYFTAVLGPGLPVIILGGAVVLGAAVVWLITTLVGGRRSGY